MKHLQLALSYLSILPIAPKEPVADHDWSRSVKYFSLAGLVFGFANLGVFYLLPKEQWLIALAITLTGIFLSGGLHLDGLADSFDGIACGKKTPEEIKAVMSDSRVGAFGAMSICIFPPENNVSFF